MEQSSKMTRLLEQLESETGITFQISASELDEEATAARVRALIAFCKTYDNRSLFLSRFFHGQLSREDLLEGLQRFHMKESAIWVLFLLESKHPYDPDAVSILSNLYDSGADTITELDATHMAVIRQFKKRPGKETLRQTALDLVDTLETEAMISCRVAYDTYCEKFSQLTDSYQNAHAALRIGKIFYSSDRVFGYRDLGLGKLLYHLPEDVCLSYMKEQLGNIHLDDLDDDLLQTIYVFFDSNLNASECARKLFLHRNSLVYRLNKLEKLTGLDIRKFDDAIELKVAMLLSNYLDNLPAPGPMSTT